MRTVQYGGGARRLEQDSNSYYNGECHALPLTGVQLHFLCFSLPSAADCLCLRGWWRVTDEGQVFEFLGTPNDYEKPKAELCKTVDFMKMNAAKIQGKT